MGGIARIVSNQWKGRGRGSDVHRRASIASSTQRWEMGRFLLSVSSRGLSLVCVGTGCWSGNRAGVLVGAVCDSCARCVASSKVRMVVTSGNLRAFASFVFFEVPSGPCVHVASAVVCK